ncbi:MAG: hypothetical protein ABH825_01710, partial [Candidatus Omnitrophota bacterium]
MTERIARSLYAIAPGVDSFLRKRDIHDNVPVMRQIHREIRDNPMVLGQVTVHQFLWDVLYRYWDIGDTASIKAFLRIMKTLNYKFDDYMDEAMRPQGTAQEVKQDSGATLVPKVRMRSRTAGGAMDKYLDPPFGAGDGINFKLNLKKVLSAADQKWIADKIANVLRSLLKGFPAARVLIDGLLPAPEAGYITFGPAASESILSQI